jgi:diguanylate cyclase (GGDEF)-like protein
LELWSIRSIVLLPLISAAYLLVTQDAWVPAVALIVLAPIIYGALRRLATARRQLRRVQHDLSRRNTELATLHAIGREIVSSFRPDRVFATIERECRKIFEFDCSLIALLDRSTGAVYAAYRHRRRQSTELSSDLPLQQLARWVWEHKRGKHVDDVTHLSPDSPLRGEWLAAGIRSLLLAPLLVDGEVVGVLALQSERPAQYDDHQLGLLTTIAQQAAIVIESARHYELATVDSLTGLYVRDYFFSRLDEEDERARRYGGRFAVLMVDVDGFKEINDRNGHLAGDQYLREISCVVRDQLRAADIACRYGGDEFCLLLPQTGLLGARAIAERIRAAVSRRIVGVDGLALRTTVSIGLAVYPDHDAGDLRGLMRKADEAMYRAKRSGRDRVVPSAA